MANEVAVTTSKLTRRIVRHELVWSVDSGSSPFTIDLPASIGGQDGRIIKVVTYDGANAPTAGYDLELLHEFGVDIFGGKLFGLSGTQEHIPRYGSEMRAEPPDIYGMYQLRITDCGTPPRDGVIVIWRTD